jgi:anti-sigma factor RsiW
MSCEYVQERISPLLDQRVDAAERETVLAHMESCRTCSAHYESMQNLRSALLGVDAPPMPANLRQELQVLASHEHARRVSRLTLAARINHLKDRLHLVFDNIMQPFGVPVASGLVSALMLFALLAPSLSFARRSGADESTAVATYPQLEDVGQGNVPQVESPDSFGAQPETVLELKISPEGKVWDWTVVQGTLTPDLEQMILLARFTPATVFGRRSWGMARILYKHAYIIEG